MLLVTAALAAPPRAHELTLSYTYDEYARDFHKPLSADAPLRRRIFARRIAEMVAHNAGPSTYKRGVNMYTDWTNEERRRLLGYKPIPHPSTPLARSYVSSGMSAPDSFDWRSATPRVLTAVKDQGHCGSCWAFAATETMESHLALSTGVLPVLSTGQIVDCVPNPLDCGGTGGCNGATAQIAYSGATSGLVQEFQYPYERYFAAAHNCSAIPAVSHAAMVTGWTNLPSNQEPPMLDIVANVGPVAVNVDASTWHDYESGVFDGCPTGDVDINHVVQLVGYTPDSWIIRNSWSPWWGELGYIRLPRDLTCRNDTQPQDGTGCKGGPSVVTVCGACGVMYDSSFPHMRST